ncbi:SusC/RagA family TonB-linked outer membrane protein [Pontibacter litorisediminis]|uniref:SusC/RagA family TonB-linked outer membrane protein n=1 Tax=Pontibacter litorisediminis TaxID=1846260 RepID=UPI0023EC3714|nr:SusC/RagA family TonB-linked outer membrane protein [Pontibacter litorisediminis]
MKNYLRCILWGLCMLLLHAQGFAQGKTVSGTVTSAEDKIELPGVSVTVKGKSRGSVTDASGRYTINNVESTDVLVFSFIGMKPTERTVGNASTIDVALQTDTETLDEVVVTALGIKQEKKALGYAVTEVKGATIAQTQRENFVNGLAGRVAGVDVNTTSGMPGASTSIMIRGVSSLSGSNQPLFVVDGLPISNSTFNTSAFASTANSATSLNNRSTDFTNRAADINPEDIESITILKGPEASALYGIDAASGAVVITTKRGKSGAPRIDYNNSFRLERINKFPEVQHVYDRGDNGVTDPSGEATSYFGGRYPEGTQFYDNIDNFFQNGFTQKHNLSLSGGSEKATYRISAGYTDQEGFVPGTDLTKFNLTSAVTAEMNKYISADLTFSYTNTDNNSAFKGAGGPLLGLLTWPGTDDASVYLTPNGERRFYSTGDNEIENPFFNVNKNTINNINNRYITNARLMIEPLEWLRFVGNAGFDYSSGKITMVRHPESAYGFSRGGIFDQSLDNNGNFNLQYYGEVDRSFFGSKLNTNLKVGSAVYSQETYTQAVTGERFLAPGLFSIENTDNTTHRGRNRLSERRRIGVFGNLTLDYDNIFFLTLTGRNDWSSTLPLENRSFFYPSIGGSFIFTELEPLRGISNVLSYGKLRGSWAQVGKDANPYSIRAFLEPKGTTGGGFGYGFTGPSPNLRPEMTTSYEFGTELKFFNNRIGIDATYFNKLSEDQIVQDMRLSYATGFVLQAFNAGKMRTEGIEMQFNATPVANSNFTWDVLANFTHLWSELISLPTGVNEFYMSDTWLYGNVRNGSVINGPLTTLTGFDYQRNEAGQLLIDPNTGYPLRDLTEWVVVGDRQPDFTVGLTNSFAYKNLSLSFLLDFRKGGDIYNGTEHFLTARGLSMRTMDRENPVVYEGVLKDGNENSANPTPNTKVIDPSRDANFWSTSYGLPEVDFIEKDINWMRLRDVTLNYNFDSNLLSRAKFIKSGSVFVTATDLFIITNYSGLDPVVNGNSAAVGGSGGVGFDYGNFPMPIGVNFGVRLGF